MTKRQDSRVMAATFKTNLSGWLITFTVEPDTKAISILFYY